MVIQSAQELIKVTESVIITSYILSDYFFNSPIPLAHESLLLPQHEQRELCSGLGECWAFASCVANEAQFD